MGHNGVASRHGYQVSRGAVSDLAPVGESAISTPGPGHSLTLARKAVAAKPGTEAKGVGACPGTMRRDRRATGLPGELQREVPK